MLQVASMLLLLSWCSACRFVGSNSNLGLHIPNCCKRCAVFFYKWSRRNEIACFNSSDTIELGQPCVEPKNDDPDSGLVHHAEEAVESTNYSAPRHVMCWIYGRAEVGQVLDEHFSLSNMAVVACGPDSFLQTIREECRARGIADADVFILNDH